MRCIWGMVGNKFILWWINLGVNRVIEFGVTVSLFG